MRHLARILCLLLLAGAAPMPMQARPFAVNVGPAQQVVDGITVSGTAWGMAPARSVLLSMDVTARDHVTPIGEADVQPLIDALVQAGVPRDAVHVPAYERGGVKLRAIRVQAEIEHPDAAAVDRGIATMTKFLLTTPSLWVETANAAVYSGECTRVQQQAEDAIVRQARLNAAQLARDAGVTLGTVTAIDARNGAMMSGAACTTNYPIRYPEAILRTPEYLHVRVYANATLRFAIR
jgi:hypothetical protein